MKQIRVVLLLVGALLSSIPGVGLLLKPDWCPPGVMRWGFPAVIEVVGIATLLAVLLGRDRIRRMRPKRLLRRSLAFLLCGVVAFIALLACLDVCVIYTNGDTQPVWFPIFLRAEAAEMVAEAGSRQAALVRHGHELELALDRDHAGIWLLTYLLLVLSASVAVSGISAGLSMLALRIPVEDEQAPIEPANTSSSKRGNA